MLPDRFLHLEADLFVPDLRAVEEPPPAFAAPLAALLLLLVADFFEALFLADLLDAAFLEPVLLEAAFLEAVFFEALFLAGIFSPFSLASDKPIAIACLRLVTFLPLPDRSVPAFFSCITSSTFYLHL